MQVYQQPIISIGGKLFEGFYSCDGCYETLLIVDVAKDHTLSEKGNEVLDAFCPFCLNWLGTLRSYPAQDELGKGMRNVLVRKSGSE